MKKCCIGSWVQSTAAFLISIFLCEHEKSALFSPDLAVTWGGGGGGLSKMTLFSLSIGVHALWMCYNEQSLCLYLGGRGGGQNSSKGESNWVNVIMRHGSDQHVYQSVYWVWSKVALYHMLAKQRVTVFSGSCSHFFCPYHPVESFSVFFSCEVRGGSFLLQIGFAWLGSKCF